ncbi:hypothetical protein JCM11251_003136 [Rhodosporidiobolus azoricus]
MSTHPSLDPSLLESPSYLSRSSRSFSVLAPLAHSQHDFIPRMALRRPPTAYTLKPSDVEELKQQQTATAASTASSSALLPGGEQQAQGHQAGRDNLVERERREVEEREARGGRGRVMGQGA